MKLRNGKSVIYEEATKGCKRKREENDESSECHQGTTKKKEIENLLTLPKLPDEMILNVFKYLPLNDLQSLASASPELKPVAEDPSLRCNLHMDLWKDDEVFSYALKRPNRDNIIKLTLKCQKDPSKAKTRVTLPMLNDLKKMSCLKHLRIEGAHLTVSIFRHLAQSVETLELIDCKSSSRKMPRTKKTGLHTVYVNDCLTFSGQIKQGYFYDLDQLFSGLKKFALPFRSACQFCDFLPTLLAVRAHVLQYSKESLEEFDFSKQNNGPLRNGNGPVQDALMVFLKLDSYTNSMISSIVGHKVLRVLRLGGWECITDEHVEKIFKMDSLRELHLHACPSISDTALNNIPDNHSIKLLNLTGCSGVSERAVQRLRTRCTNMTVMF